MFRINEISLHKGTESKTYNFTEHSYIYGGNSVGKTAFTKAIDFVLGSSDNLSFDGLDYIDAVGAYVTNGNTNLWIKRTVAGEFFYRRTKNSEYSLLSSDAYKDRISEVITDNLDTKAIQVYRKVFEENISYRVFTFLNFIDEIGQGDLGSIFTRGRNIKHMIRLRKIMDFFFNYENIEKIYEKTVELEMLDSEQKALNESINEYNQSIAEIKMLFEELGLKYTGDMECDYKAFIDYRDHFTRERTKPNDDLSYLLRASHSLAEEIKVYGYLKNQTASSALRKDRTEKLLSMLGAIVANNPQYAQDVETINNMIEEIEKDKVILSLADYDVSISKILAEKNRIDDEIAVLKNQAAELDYEQTLKKIALVENCFHIVNSSVDFNKAKMIEKQIVELKQVIRELKNSYNPKNIDSFNKNLTKSYLDSNIKNVKYLNEDRDDRDFKLVFKPISQVLIAYRKEGDVDVKYSPGSMARHNHLQILVYLCMFEFLHNNFEDFPYLPLLIMDSPDQPMEASSINEIYPSLIELATKIGVQTIYISKVKPSKINDSDLIDIRAGFNPFHRSN